MNGKYCCIYHEKMEALINPDFKIDYNFVGQCAVCGGPEPYTYHVPESLWRKIVPREKWNSIICAKCFHELATNPPPSTVEKG